MHRRDRRQPGNDHDVAGLLDLALESEPVCKAKQMSHGSSKYPPSGVKEGEFE